MTVINLSRKFIYVHVPKSAGTTVTRVLSKYTTFRDLEIGGTQFGEAIQTAYKEKFNLSKHSPASNIKALIGENEWNSMFTFSIVRNPYDRAISTFKFLNNWQGTPPKMKAIVSSFRDINSFIQSDVWDQANGPDQIFRPQAFWITDKLDRGKVLVDFVGKLESLDKDVGQIISKIEGGKPIFFKCPQTNVSAGSHKLNKNSILKINQKYARDFKIFGYNMIQ